MNILLLCDEYPPGKHGGIGTAVQMLARQLVHMGHTVIVAGFYSWGYGDKDEFEDEGVKVFRFRPGLSSSFFQKNDSLTVRIATRLLKDTGILHWDIKRSIRKYEAFLKDLINTYKIEVAEVPDYNDYMRFCKTAIPFPNLGIPIAVMLHGSMTYFHREANEDVPPQVLRMEKTLLENATGVASVSRYTAKRTAAYLDYHKKIEVIYNGITIPTFPVQPSKISGRVIFTGTLVAKKGIYQLIKAWNKVHKTIPEAGLYIYGKGPVQKIKALLDIDAERSVHFMGHIPREELLEQLATAELAVFPSYAETFGLAAAEAMACGTATVFSERTSGPEVVQNGKTGMLINPDDITGISSILITLLTDKALCGRLATAGREFVQNNFGAEHITKQHIQLYQRLIDNYKSN